MKPNISEFAYGYALTENIMRWAGTPLTAAPVLPALIEEEPSSAGGDSQSITGVIPLFLQFKLSHYMMGSNAHECKIGLFDPPFYRIYLPPSKRSRQHSLLLNLEKSGNEVYYAAPAFHRSIELNRAYINHEIIPQSIFIPPSEIGALPDAEEHHIAFQLNGNAYFLSPPKPTRVIHGATFGERLERVWREKLQSGFDFVAFLPRLIAEMIDSINIQYGLQRELEDVNLRKFEDLAPLRKAAYLARTFFECELFLVREKRGSVAA